MFINLLGINSCITGVVNNLFKAAIRSKIQRINKLLYKNTRYTKEKPVIRKVIIFCIMLRFLLFNKILGVEEVIYHSAHNYLTEMNQCSSCIKPIFTVVMIVIVEEILEKFHLHTKIVKIMLI